MTCHPRCEEFRRRISIEGFTISNGTWGGPGVLVFGSLCPFWKGRADDMGRGSEMGNWRAVSKLLL